MELSLNHVGILTQDLEGSIAFYREKLGMKVAARFFQEGALDIALLRDGLASTRFSIEFIGPPFTGWRADLFAKLGPTLDHVAFLVDDVDAWHGELRRQGVKFLETPQSFLTDRRMSFQDPSGIVVEMMTHLDSADASLPAPEAVTGQGNEYRLDHVSMVGWDLDVEERFYVVSLGLTKLFERRKNGGGYIFLAYPLHRLDEGRYAANLEVMGPPLWEREEIFLAERGPGVDHVCFVVDDVDAAHEQLASDGVPFTYEPVDFGANRIAYFKDPNGVDLELELPIRRRSLSA